MSSWQNSQSHPVDPNRQTHGGFRPLPSVSYTDVVCQYGEQLKNLRPEELRIASLREGASFITVPDYKGVHLTLLDLCSLNTTYTFKDWIACVVIAWCLEKQISRICFQSSSNTGAALIGYAHAQFMKAVWFYPEASRYKLDPEIVRQGNAILVEVQRPEPEVKTLIAAFSKFSGIQLVPNFEQQIEANKIRSHLVAKYFMDTGTSFDWQVQALSSAFGPFGFYEGFESKQGQPVAPKLLGIHQSSTHPYASALAPDLLTPDAIEYLYSMERETKYIEPTLFRSTLTPDLTSRMEATLRQFGGKLDVMTHEIFNRYLPMAIDILNQAGLQIGLDLQGEIVEKAGLVSIIGALRAVDKGVLSPDESVLIALTGGARPDIKSSVRPDFTIRRESGAEDVQSVFKQIVHVL